MCRQMKDSIKKYFTQAVYRTFDTDRKRFHLGNWTELKMLSLETFRGMRQEMEDAGISYEEAIAEINNKDTLDITFAEVGRKAIRKDRDEPPKRTIRCAAL